MIDWKNTTIAPDRSHHLYRKTPFYKDRFEFVMKYHEPGLAPVYVGNESWHIDVFGKPAYNNRFWKVFGFYGGLAAFEEQNGWAHLLPDGTAAYDVRYEWCGNFQGGLCTVRLAEGLYRHIHKNGKSAYEDVEEYKRRSPAWNTHKMKNTPLLVHTNTNDADVNVLEVEHLIKSLKADGKKFEYKIYEDIPGGHSFDRMDTKKAKEIRLKVYKFLATYLKPARPFKSVDELQKAAYRF